MKRLAFNVEVTSYCQDCGDYQHSGNADGNTPEAALKTAKVRLAKRTRNMLFKVGKKQLCSYCIKRVPKRGDIKIYVSNRRLWILRGDEAFDYNSPQSRTVSREEIANMFNKVGNYVTVQCWNGVAHTDDSFIIGCVHINATNGKKVKRWAMKEVRHETKSASRTGHNRH